MESDTIKGAPTQPLASAVVQTDALGASERLNELRLELTQMLAESKAPDAVLVKLCVGIEDFAPGVHIAVTRLTEAGVLNLEANHGLTPALARALQGILVEGVGVASGAAAFHKKRVEVHEILAHPSMSKLHKPCMEGGYSACVSIPLLSESGQTLGTLDAFVQKAPGHGVFDKAMEVAHYIAELTLRARATQGHRLELELRVHELQTEVAGLHSELDAGKAALAHDVRAPIKVLQTQIKAMMDRADLLKDHASHESLEKMRITAMRTEHIIGDILQISMLTRAELEPEEIDITALAKKIGEEVKLRLHRTDTKLDVQAEMTAFADKRFVQMVLDCLISNALRFTTKASGPLIQIGFSERAGKKAFFVRDNGAGFHPHTATRIFEPFERAHAERDYTGSGLALATVKRLVERHGGKVWANSSMGTGSVFAFTLGEANDTYSA